MTLAALIAPPARAHDVRLSGIKFIHAADGVLVVSVVTHISKLGEKNLDAEIRRRLKVRFDGVDYVPGKSNLSLDRPNDQVTWQAEHRAPVKRIQVLQRLFPEDPGSHFSVVVFEKGRVVQQVLLDEKHPTFGTHETASSLAVFGSYFRQGVEHIVGGPDHLCFVLGLLLLSGSIGALLKTVTAFTLAHSITLTVAALGIWVPPSRIVEPLIALSIIAVAIENVRRPNSGVGGSDWRPHLAFSFGLVHGFGFAGALSAVGLPRDALGWALGAFNIGVEVGQACIVLAVAPLLARVARKSAPAHRGVVLVGSGAIALLGVWWFAQRLGAGG